MDVHIHRRPLDAYESVIEHLKEKHIHITETRKAIIAYIIDSHEHPSADKIYRDLLPEHPNVSLVAVYNNMKVLVDEGFAAESKIANDTTACYDFMGHRHTNIVYRNCGEITDFMDVDTIDVGKEAYEQAGYQIAKIQLTTYGTCPKCQEELKTAGESFMTCYEDR